MMKKIWNVNFRRFLFNQDFVKNIKNEIILKPFKRRYL